MPFAGKNCLFVGHPEAGERNVVIDTLPGSCRRHGVNPFDYLKDLFTRLPATKITEIRQFTPSHWAKMQSAQVVRAARTYSDGEKRGAAAGLFTES